MAAQAMVEVENLSVIYGRRGRRHRGMHAVRDVSFSVEPGTILALVGESGCGKTSVARSVVGLNRDASGSIRFDGIELVGASRERWRRVRPRIQMVFQDPYSSLNPRWTTARLVAEPLARYGRRRGLAGARETDLLDEVGLGEHMSGRRPWQLSGGQRQRVVIARALATAPDLLVCDEPVSALDVSVQAQVLSLLDRLRRDRSLTCIYISHNLATVRWLADQVGVMYAGHLVELGPVAEVMVRPRHPYTAALLSATLSSDPAEQAARRPIVLTGDPPAIGELDRVTGCPFRSRCWLYQELGEPEDCAAITPPAVRAAGQTACHHDKDLPAALSARSAHA